jgi:hypothetical protein
VANVTPPAMTSWSKVVMIEASHFDVNELTRRSNVINSLTTSRTSSAHTTPKQNMDRGVTQDFRPGVYVQTVKEDPHRSGHFVHGT